MHVHLDQTNLFCLFLLAQKLVQTHPTSVYMYLFSVYTSIIQALHDVEASIRMLTALEDELKRKLEEGEEKTKRLQKSW